MPEIDTKKVREYITKMKVSKLRKLVAIYNRKTRLRITKKKKAEIIEVIMNEKEHNVFRKAIHNKILGNGAELEEPDRPKRKPRKPKEQAKAKPEPKKEEPKKEEPKKEEPKKEEEKLDLSFLKNYLLNSVKKVDTGMSKTQVKGLIMENRRNLLKELKKIDVPKEHMKEKRKILSWYRKFNLEFTKELVKGDKSVAEMKALLKKNDKILFNTLKASISPT